MPDYSTLVAVDRAHADQLEMSWKTWARHRPEILDRPLFLVADACEITGGNELYWRDRLRFVYEAMRGPVATVHWAWPFDQARSDRDGMTQRERMLTGLVRAAAMVPTPWSLKLDTDAPAMQGGPWIDPEWFQPLPCTPFERWPIPAEADRWRVEQQAHRRLRRVEFTADVPGPGFELVEQAPPAMVVSPWPYAKPADLVERLNRWGDSHRDLAKHAPLPYQPQPGSDIVAWPGIISYVCFIRTAFARWASDLAPQRLPCASQDGFHNYVALRAGWPIRRVRMKQYGWTHVRRNGTLRRLCAEALA